MEIHTRNDKPLGLRERKKNEMRNRIAKATLKLVAKHGLRNVSVRQIVAEAGTSQRTFHNYFESKEEALSYNPGKGTIRLAALLRDRPDDEPAVDALTHAIGDMIHSETSLQGWQSREWLAHEHPHLAYQYLAQMAELEEQLVEALVPRVRGQSDPQFFARVLAGAALAVTRIAAMTAKPDRNSKALRETVEILLTNLSRGLSSQDLHAASEQ